jgi:hypothetical protein
MEETHLFHYIFEVLFGKLLTITFTTQFNNLVVIEVLLGELLMISSSKHLNSLVVMEEIHLFHYIFAAVLARVVTIIFAKHFNNLESAVWPTDDTVLYAAAKVGYNVS